MKPSNDSPALMNMQNEYTFQSIFRKTILNENRTEIEFYVLDKEGKAHIIATRKNR